MSEILITILTISIILTGFKSSKSDEEIVRTEPFYVVAYEGKTKKEEDYTAIYKVYALGIGVGEVYFIKKDNRIEARGQTYPSLRFLYNYDFVYLEQNDYKALYEKEKEREKIYENQEIYEKKPWLPIISQFFKSRLKEDDILNMKIKINDAPVKISKQDTASEYIYIFEPQNSKTKRITIYINKNEDVPYLIEIEGKVNITLKRIK
ncbi:MAG TPA: hypothetical protein DEA57_01485 [Sulfurihydrogenibium sp.]|uniref:hypothetical protein n=1 Tax=Sulfurihydrogenibium sp. (strain YO3AOP1) TaxID=436114 RepID=UPI0001723F4E|nr:hypothetical protein [Sulfurihydrogenibium sp. YO3AOP1]ACD66266.1 hypothetical protein SYO3AOP1_0629 [Sulfurihydrogenibium sp. YO3AOP1]HBT98145.1 hypothetical protein [Sulfurihydrogenibium sp.]